MDMIVVDHLIGHVTDHVIVLWICAFQEPKLSFDDARKICVKTIVNTADFACIQLVYGFAGKHLTHSY